jgi:hypothetical protein
MTNVLVPLVAAVFMRGIEMPPAQYDHEPTVPYRVHYVSQAFANELCGANLREARRYKPDARIAGCTDTLTNDIYISRDFSPETRVYILRHEKAHVNGWVHARGKASRAAIAALLTVAGAACAAAAVAK